MTALHYVKVLSSRSKLFSIITLLLLHVRRLRQREFQKPEVTGLGSKETHLQPGTIKSLQQGEELEQGSENFNELVHYNNLLNPIFSLIFFPFFHLKKCLNNPKS